MRVLPAPRARPCGAPGLPQAHRTCWFNAALNGFLLSDVGSAVLASMFYALPHRKQAQLLAADLTCPTSVQGLGDHVLAYAGRYLVGQRAGLRRGAHALQTVRTVYPEIGEQGHFSAEATRDILSALGLQWVVQDGFEESFVTDDTEAVMLYCRDHGDTEAFQRRFPAFRLSHVLLRLKAPGFRHAVVQYQCRGKMYAYDSNMGVAFEAATPERVAEVLREHYKRDLAVVDFSEWPRVAVFLRPRGTGSARFDEAYPLMARNAAADARLAHHMVRVIDARGDTERGLAMNAALGDPELSGPGKVQVANAARYYRARPGKVGAAVAAIHMAAAIRMAEAVVGRAMPRKQSRHSAHSDAWHSAHSDAWHSDGGGWNSDTANSARSSAKKPRV